ncbi:Hypothetical protein Yei C [Mycoplasmopsis agalactiae 14628]|uniref:Carbohydrate kinase PfkB domain-containing protein n=1 Tax=Mycoplasmopsis agalactiae 14628 TaxID=1110504 RepID=I5D593_MYCAA|nr:PfkB family carbohydrate kinase [Mycoplasmopsis agalactiae]EIN14852.1 Hypothetical protein Yei C [Mycoplasmopsis agalactiae 14628]
MNVVVIGSVNYDLYAKIDNEIILKDSNPSNIYSTLGGVAYNIAKNLKLANVQATLIAAVGDDLEAKWIKKQLDNDLISHKLIVKEGYKSAKYVAFLDRNSDMSIAASDTKITESVNYDDLMQYKDILDSATYICLDANLSEDLIAKICKNYSHKFIVAEGVSCHKILKFKPVLQYISVMKANKIEFQNLLNSSEEDIFILASEAIKNGAKAVVITDGANGSIYFDQDEKTEFYMPNSIKPLSASGAGDAFCAGLIYGLINKLQILKIATIFSKFALLSVKTVNDELNDNDLMKEYMEVN